MDSEESIESEVNDQPLPEAAETGAPEQVKTAEKVEKLVENIEKPIEPEKPPPPISRKKALICIGEYPIKILLKGPFLSNKEDVLPIFVDISSEEISKWSRASLDADNVLGLDAKVDTHFWYYVLSYLGQNEDFIARLKNKPVDNKRGAIVVSSSWDGVGSALLPTLVSQLKEWNVNSVALAVLPSKLQPSDAHLNAMFCVGTCASKDFSTVLLVERDQLNKQVGVNRNGSTVTGNIFLNYILELMLAKETFVQELSELSRAFNIRIYTILSATGASVRIFGSLENILNTALLRPLLTFNLSSASLLYVLVRLPIQLKEKFSRDKIELTIADWFKEKANLKSIVVAEPLYVDEINDRIDVVMFVGGFDATGLFTSIEKKANAIKTSLIKNGSLKEEEWKAVVKSLITG